MVCLISLCKSRGWLCLRRKSSCWWWFRKVRDAATIWKRLRIIQISLITTIPWYQESRKNSYRALQCRSRKIVSQLSRHHPMGGLNDAQSTAPGSPLARLRRLKNRIIETFLVCIYLRWYFVMQPSMFLVPLASQHQWSLGWTRRLRSTIPRKQCARESLPFIWATT